MGIPTLGGSAPTQFRNANTYAVNFDTFWVPGTQTRNEGGPGVTGQTVENFPLIRNSNRRINKFNFLIFCFSLALPLITPVHTMVAY